MLRGINSNGFVTCHVRDLALLTVARLRLISTEDLGLQILHNFSHTDEICNGSLS
jgi:hypothetical protein